MKKPDIIVVMGVSGSGKSTIGKLLADQLRLPFFDGDDYHPQENVIKMRAGVPLSDPDRHSWLIRLHHLIGDLQNQDGGVIACSALKESYRKILSEGKAGQIKWVLLEGEYDLIKERMQMRQGHFMPPDLLASQFATLEIPPYAIRISIDNDPETIVSNVINKLTLS